MKNSEKIIKKASEFSSFFSNDKRIEAIFLGGSGSRNVADEYSDIEIFIIWNCKTSVDIRKSILKDVKYTTLVAEEFEYPSEWTTSIIWDKGKIDIYHWEDNLLNYLKTNALEKFSTDLSVQCSIASILDAKAIKGEEYINLFKQQFLNYPEELAKKCLKEAAFIESWGARYALLAREDYLALSQLINDTLIRAFRMLFAINKVYIRSSNFKWLNYQCNLLKYKPGNLNNRINESVKNINLEGINELDKIIHEIFELAYIKFPDVDLSAELEVINFERMKNF